MWILIIVWLLVYNLVISFDLQNSLENHNRSINKTIIMGIESSGCTLTKEPIETLTRIDTYDYSEL